MLGLSCCPCSREAGTAAVVVATSPLCPAAGEQTQRPPGREEVAAALVEDT